MQAKALQNMNSALANIARGAPLSQTLAGIVYGVEVQLGDLPAAVLLWDEAGAHLSVAVAPRLPEAYRRAVDGMAFVLGQSRQAIDRAFELLSGTDDMASLSPWSALTELSLQHGLYMCASVPIRAASGDVLGLFVVYSMQGSRHDVPRQPIADAATLAAVAIERDRLERRVKKAEAALHDNETRLALAIEGSGTGIWDRNVTTGEIHYSATWKAILGYKPFELTNRIEDSYKRLHPDDHDYVRQTIQAHFDRKTESYRVEHRIRCKDGSYKWISSRGKVVSRDAEGNPLRMIGVTVDISAMRSLTEKMQQVCELIVRLSDEVSEVSLRQTMDEMVALVAEYGQNEPWMSPELRSSIAELRARIDGHRSGMAPAKDL